MPLGEYIDDSCLSAFHNHPQTIAAIHILAGQSGSRE